MSNVIFSFNAEMKELFDYPDPSVPIVVWQGDFCDLYNRCLDHHWHSEFEYCVVRAGTVGFTVDGNYTEVRQGNAIFINSNAMHAAAQVGDTPARIFTVSFLPALLTANEYGTVYRKHFLPILKSSVKGFLIDIRKKYAADILQCLNEICRVYDRQETDFELMLISHVSRAWSLTVSYLDEYREAVSLSITNHHNEEIAKSILNYIHNHYGEDITVDDMAKYAQTSRSGCFRSFRHYMNNSPMEYLTAYRMTRAISLIAGSKKSITQIAAECGFSSSSYFGKLFRKKYGMSPLAYKKQL